MSMRFWFILSFTLLLAMRAEAKVICGPLFLGQESTRIVTLDPQKVPSIGLDIASRARDEGHLLDLAMYFGKEAPSHEHFDLAPLQRILHRTDFNERMQNSLLALYQLSRSSRVNNHGTGYDFPLQLSSLNLQELEQSFRPQSHAVYEIGLLFARFSDGTEESIFFSSKEEEFIDGSAFEAAGDLMEDLATERGAKVTSLDFFHTHPDVSQDPGLVKFLNSRKDVSAAKAWQGMALDRWDLSVLPEAAQKARFFAMAKEADGELWLSELILP